MQGKDELEGTGWRRDVVSPTRLRPAPAARSSLAGAKEKIAALAPSALVLVMDEKGNELVARNADKPFVPASVAKIVTAWLALKVLAADYRFETGFYLNGDRVLYIRGGGDPFLISEELAQLASALVAAIGKQPLTGIVLDASYYPSDIRIPGIEDSEEAYDALNSALAVNFNTIHAVRKGKTVHSAEKQTPITPLAISQFLARGSLGRGRISLTQDPTVGLQYAGELIAAFIERAGGSLKGKISTGVVPEGWSRSTFTASHAPFRRSSPSCSWARTTTSRTKSSWRSAGVAWAHPSALRSRSGSRTRCSSGTASPNPSNSRKAPASAAATVSLPAALPSCCASSSLMPPCSAAVTAPCSRPARFPASAPWRGMPTPPSMGECAS